MRGSCNPKETNVDAPLLKVVPMAAGSAARFDDFVIYLHRCPSCGRPEARRERVGFLFQGFDETCIPCRRQRFRLISGR